MKIIPDKKHKDMYRVEWPDGDISVGTPNPGMPDGHYGFYNKSRAFEFLRRKGIEKYDRGVTYGSPFGRD